MSEMEDEIDSKIIQPNVMKTRSDFIIGKIIGEGSYSSVFHAKDKYSDIDADSSTVYEYALKRLDKLHLKKENKCLQADIEKNILLLLNHDFIVKCKIHFEDSNYLYICLELAKGGELQQMIKNKRILNEEKGILNTACDLNTAKFYVAEIISSLEYLDSLNIIHRDLKPENILLTLDGHIKITDFGSACFTTDKQSVETIGTAEYLSPEFQEFDEDSEIKITRSCDLWALGIIFYQLLVGKTPFYDITEYLIFDRIMNHVTGKSKLEFNENISQNAQNLISSLLSRNPSERIGAGNSNSENGFKALKQHPFFNNLDFNHLKDEIPPYKPSHKIFPNSKYMFDGDSTDWDNESENLDEKIKWTRFFKGEMQIYTSQVYKRKVSLIY
jgi:3-phosphoinositide dependent protein kinase-1